MDMAPFSLTSNNYFLTPIPNSKDIAVVDCPNNLTSFDTINSPHSHWTLRARIGKLEQYNALEVFGTIISGDKLAQLANNLTLTSNSQTFNLMVNREGLCFLSVDSRFVKRVRLNDYFGWSKFGVKPEIGTVWNKFNMFDRSIVVGLEEMKKSLSETNDRLSEQHDALVSTMKELEELKKVAKEKEKELRELVKSRLVGKMKHADTLKDVADSLMDSMWDLNKLARREMMVFWNLAVVKAGAIPSSLRRLWMNMNQVK